jgi:ADP-heptose:LPS heptosyltransferase
MRSILVLRLSSMGDVLLTMPVLDGILEKNQDLQIIFVTRRKFEPYFSGIRRLTIIAFDPEGIHKGIAGLFRLHKEIRCQNFDLVIDLHGTLRTIMIDLSLGMAGYKVFRIKKHRSIRRQVIRKKGPGIMVPHAVTRYLEVFFKAGLQGKISSFSSLGSEFKKSLATVQSATKRIGIAPISKHKTKNWGLTNIGELIQLINTNFNCEVHLFGGAEDQLDLGPLSGGNVYIHAGIAKPKEEISLISKMDIFISMDSANMHLASLIGIPTISIWGATDPKLGFAPLNQPISYAIYSDSPEVYCRPCSVYGEVPCRRSDSPMICMTSITPQRVLGKIMEILSQSDTKS